jgi:hypothetical protein
VDTCGKSGPGCPLLGRGSLGQTGHGRPCTLSVESIINEHLRVQSVQQMGAKAVEHGPEELQKTVCEAHMLCCQGDESGFIQRLATFIKTRIHQ